MNRAWQAVLIGTFVGFSWLAMQVVHELGHVVIARITGAEVVKVLERRPDEVLARCAAARAKRCKPPLNEYLKASGPVERATRNLHVARRLLARAQGDEYRFGERA